MKKNWILFLFVLLTISACSSASTGPKITVEGVWGRNSPMMATAGAFYMQIKNSGSEADKLVSASSEACGTIELHESYMMDNGAMGMRPVEGGSIEIPAGTTVELKVGGLHVMCLNKTSEFQLGDKYPLTLVFENSGEMTVEVSIQEEP
ncbi:MAG: copper chaperone PCu(A)C [Anaerolineales bacterium]|nr:copper chaperone PCu(A)C [Anaerolineales bacterium]